MEIRDYNQGDEHSILKLFHAAFDREMSLEYWKWRFEKNPAGKYLIKLMWSGKELIGHYAVSPAMLSRNHEEFKTALSMTTMTHPEYGGKGVFGLLANALYDSIYKDHGINHVWGFPNTNSHYAFIKKLGWKDIGVVHELALSRIAFKAMPQNEFRVVSLVDTSEVSNQLLSQESGSQFQIVKSKEYLRWRFDENPTQQYCLAALVNTQNVQQTVLVFKQYDAASGKIINILDIFGQQTIENLSILFEYAFQTFPESVTCTLWMNLWRKEYGILEKLRFIPSGNITYLGFREHNKLNEPMSYLHNWNLSFSDSDVY